MGAMVSQITSLTSVYSTVYSGADQRKHQCSASLAFLGGIHRWPVNSPHKWPVTRKMFPIDDVIMRQGVVYAVCWKGIQHIYKHLNAVYFCFNMKIFIFSLSYLDTEMLQIIEILFYFLGRREYPKSHVIHDNRYTRIYTRLQSIDHHCLR